MKTEIIRNKKVIYFADPLFSDIYESIEDECKDIIQIPLQDAGIVFEKIHCTNIPPFGKMTYDILFFDWGGMSIGNSLLESFCRYIIKEADDYPNRLYIMVSTFTSYAMTEALLEFGNKENIFTNIKDFINYFNEL